MIVAVLVVSVVLWSSYRLMSSLGLEAGRDECISSSGVWTALDELQLVRLLVDSASAERAAANSTDNSESSVQQKDAP